MKLAISAGVLQLLLCQEGVQGYQIAHLYHYEGGLVTTPPWDVSEAKPSSRALLQVHPAPAQGEPGSTTVSSENVFER